MRMGRPVTIKSSRDGITLEFIEYSGHHYGVALRGADFNGAASVYAEKPVEDPARLEDFFRDLAANWRGWPGEKTYESLEEELLLKATSDCLGHTELEVRLTSGPPPFHWMLRAALLIEAGQLESIAKHVEEFFSAV